MFRITRRGKAFRSRRFGRQFPELLWSECPDRRRARVARRRYRNRQLSHRVAVRHFDRESEIVLSGRHIPADKPTAQFRNESLAGFVSLRSFFNCLCTLVGPIEKAHKRRHGTPPFSKPRMSRGGYARDFLNASSHMTQ